MKHRLVVLIISLFATISAYSEDNVDIVFRVTADDYNSNNVSHDGTRWFVAPFELSNASAADLALCLYTDVGTHKCIPTPNQVPLRSPCPDRKTCVFNFKIPKNTEYVAISVFDLDTTGHTSIRNATSLIKKLANKISDTVNSDLGLGYAVNSIANLNNRRWSWIESLSFYIGVNDHNEVSDEITNKIDQIVREHASSTAPPSLLDSFNTGRISAPFDRRHFAECSYPVASCYYEYVEVMITAEDLLEVFE